MIYFNCSQETDFLLPSKQALSRRRNLTVSCEPLNRAFLLEVDMPKGIYIRTPDMKTGQYQKTKEHKRNLSIALMGRQPSSGCFKKGDIPWCKGKKNIKISGKNNPHWNGGRVIDRGYIRIYKPEHPNANGKYVFEHRLVVEKIIGRYLLTKEESHHINKIKDDNRPENLMAFVSKSAHRRFEKGGKIKIEEIIFNGHKFSLNKEK